MRSPVLGYNHNVRYAGRMWHVQTEDSGVSNPHIFTHLFHDGTILATKRLDYEPTSDQGVVQKLMQAQHKAMLRDLKHGAFDDKISRFIGAPVVREARDLREDPTEPHPFRPPSGEFDDLQKTDPSIPPVGNVPLATAPTMAGTPPTPPSTPSPSRPPSRPNLTPSRPAIPIAASRTGQRAVTGVGGRRPTAHPYGGGKPTAEGVVVARPAVIVGDPEGTSPRANPSTQRQRRYTPPPIPAQPPPIPAQAQAPNIFGGDLISEKSLDEVILAYLSEDLNEK